MFTYPNGGRGGVMEAGGRGNWRADPTQSTVSV
jgi:hypothetical protein